MSPAEIRALRHKLSMTQADFGRAVMGPRDPRGLQTTVSRWEHGVQLPCGAARVVMTLLAGRAHRVDARDPLT